MADRFADPIQEVATLLAGSLNLTLGQNMFIGELPEPNVDGQTSPDGLYLIELPGPAADMYVDTETYLFDIWSSSSDSNEAKRMLRRAYEVLERKGNYALTNWYVYFSYASGTIRDEGRSREGTKLFSQSWTIICRNMNNIS